MIEPPFSSEDLRSLPLHVLYNALSGPKPCIDALSELERILLKRKPGSMPRKPSEEALLFVESAKRWIRENRSEAMMTVLGRSPHAVAKMAIRDDSRLPEEAERELRDACEKEPANSRNTWVEYCGHFSIVPADHERIFMEALFGDKGEHRSRERASIEVNKRYLRKDRRTRERFANLLESLVERGDFRPDDTVSTLLEFLKGTKAG